MEQSTDDELRRYWGLIDAAIMHQPKRVEAQANTLAETEHERRALIAVATLVQLADTDGVTFDRYAVALRLAKRARR